MKKRILLSAAVVMLVGLSSCGKTIGKPEQLDKNFTCEAVFSENDNKYQANLERVDGVGWNAVFTSPETIEGMEVSLLNDKCTVNFKDLTYTVDRAELPQYGFLSLVTSSVDNCISGKNLETSQKGEDFLQKGTIKGADYTAQISEKTISNVNIANQITAEFSNYKAK